MCKQSTIDGINAGKLIAVPKWLAYFRVVSPMAILALAFYTGVKINNIESRIFDTVRQKEQVIMITQDKTIHMSYQEKVQVFVPRTEIEYKLEIMDKNLEKIMKKLNVN